MKVIVNGREREAPEAATLAALCDELDLPESGVAVALDGGLVSRDAWSATELYQGARIEVLTAVGGG
jgi:sulfur carrier protein